jgi:hypothetical protein
MQGITAWVAEVWFNVLPSGFAQRWAALVGYSLKVRCVSQEPVAVGRGYARRSGSLSAGALGLWGLRPLFGVLRGDHRPGRAWLEERSGGAAGAKI